MEGAVRTDTRPTVILGLIFATLTERCGSEEWCSSTGCCSQPENGCEGVPRCPFGARCCEGGGCATLGESFPRMSEVKVPYD